VLAARTIDRRPVVPPWLRSRSEFRALAVWLGRYGAHASAFHLARSPLYLARLVTRAPPSGWRVARAVVWWVLDREQRPIREGAVQRNAVAEYLALSRLRRERVKVRAIWAVGLAALLSIGSAVAVSVAQIWVSAMCGVLVIAVLGVAGTPSDRRVLDAAKRAAAPAGRRPGPAGRASRLRPEGDR
jgi:S-DNA-T family DNA segregation ATPase FtsK/SpoIIIE